MLLTKKDFASPALRLFKMTSRHKRQLSIFCLPLLFSIISSSLCGCKVLQLQLQEPGGSKSWLTAGGDLAQTGFRETGPTPPLELVNTFTFNAAPVQNLTAINDVLIVGTQRGRIYAYDTAMKKAHGRIKLQDKIEPILSAHKDGLLLLGVKLGRETLACYDMQTAKYRWKRRAGLLSGQPVVADSSVYVVARFKHADRYSLATGEHLWKYAFDSQAHTSSSLSEKLMIFGDDGGNVHALDRATGELRWQSGGGAAIFASPVIQNELIFVASIDSTVRALRLADGGEVWRWKAGGGVRQTPAIGGGVLALGAGDGKCYGLDAKTGEMLWSFQAGSAISTSPLILGEVVYFGSLDKNFYALDLQTGKRLWQAELRGRVRTNPLVVGDYVVVGSEDKHVFLFKEASSKLAPSE